METNAWNNDDRSFNIYVKENIYLGYRTLRSNTCILSSGIYDSKYYGTGGGRVAEERMINEIEA